MDESYMKFLEKQISTTYQHIYNLSTSLHIFKQVYTSVMKDHVELWEKALVDIELAVSKANFSTWFNGTYIIKNDDG